MNTAKYNKNEVENSWKPYLYILCLFISFLFLLLFVYSNFPELEESEYKYMKPSMSIGVEELQNIGRILSRYKNQYYFEVISGIIVLYIFLQTFAIPGSLFLSMLSGFLFEWYVALTVICFCSACGASLCFLISFLVGKPIVMKYYPERLRDWQEKARNHQDNMLFYIIFLRVFPGIPNGFVNVASPLVHIPIWPFWLGTFVGVIPLSMLAIEGGQVLYQLTEMPTAFSMRYFVIVGGSCIMSLLPVIFRHRLKKYQ